MDTSQKIERIRKNIERLKKAQNATFEKLAAAMEQKLNELESAIAAKEE